MANSVAILIRLFNEERYVGPVLTSAYNLTWDGPLRVYVAVDGGTTDATQAEVDGWIEHYARRTDLEWVRVTHPHLPLSAATAVVLRGVASDWIYFLDADNRMPVDRLVRHHALHPNAPGVCAITVRKVDLATGLEVDRAPGEEPTYLRLLQGNQLDGLNLRIRGDYARERLLPLLEAANGEVLEDWLFVLAAAWDNVLCWHDVLLGEYGLRSDSLTARRSVRPAETRTRELVLERLGDPTARSGPPPTSD